MLFGNGDQLCCVSFSLSERVEVARNQCCRVTKRRAP